MPSKNTKIVVCMLFIALLVHMACFPMFSNADDGGVTKVTSDMQLIGFMGPMGGGGHVYFEITGEAAAILREKAIIRYDGDLDGVLNENELYPGPGSATTKDRGYISALEYYIESIEYMGTHIRGAKPINREVRGEGWQRDVSGLLEVEASSREPIKAGFVFDSKSEVGDYTLHLLPTTLADAVYMAFSDGTFLGATASDMEPIDRSGITSLWHLSTVPGRFYPDGDYPAGWWCGSPSLGSYINDMRDGLLFSVDLFQTSSPALGFQTRMHLGTGDRGLVQVSNGTEWTTIDVIDSNVENWTFMEYDLSEYAGRVVTFRFLFESDSSGTGAGWFLDDFVIFETGPGTIVEEYFEESPQNWTLGGWGIDNSTASFGNYSLSDSPGGNYTGNTTSRSTFGPLVLDGYSNANLSLEYRADLADENDTFSVILESGGVENVVFTTNSTENWTHLPISLDQYLGSYVNVSLEVSYNETGNASGVNIDEFVITVEYPVLQNKNGSVDSGFSRENLFNRNIWRYTDTGTWICNSQPTGRYPSNINNELRLLPHPGTTRPGVFDWRFVEEVSLSFEYRGSMSPGDILVLEITTNPLQSSPTWRPLYNVTTGSQSWVPVNLEQELDSYRGNEVGIRFRFRSANGGTGGLEIGNVSTRGIVYTGNYVIRHRHYTVGTSSFYSPTVTQGDLFILRTPFGEIVTYTVTLSAGEGSSDTIEYSSFKLMENPQVLFVFFLLFSLGIAHANRRFYLDYKAALPYRHRILARKSSLVTTLSRISIVVLCLIYFVPTLGGFFIGGYTYVLIGIVLVLISMIFAKIVYSSMKKSDLAKAEREQKSEKPKTQTPRISAPPSPAPIINVNMKSPSRIVKKTKPKPKPIKSKKQERVVQCNNCAEIFSVPMDWHEETKCPACGKVAEKTDDKGVTPVESALNPDEELEEVVTYSFTADCPKCGAVIAASPGLKEKVECPSCKKSILVSSRVIEPGYNYLLLGKDTESGYVLFSTLSEGRSSLCLTTTFPEKIRRDHPMGKTSIVWITDTDSESETSMDPRRLDFEITRAIMETTCRGDAVILLDGLEYLVIENGLETVLKFMKKITDIASMDEATLLILLDPTSIGNDELSVLRREFDFVEDMDRMMEDGDDKL